MNGVELDGHNQRLRRMDYETKGYDDKEYPDVRHGRYDNCDYT
ncbi:hypothetical protein [Bacillus sonorensis]|nr:hypothetical protein CHCC20335_2491 [Bacillus paralicheniformis]